MKAFILRSPSEFVFEEIPAPIPATGFARIRIKAAALNHRDQWIREGKYAKILYPAILGSDACGVVESVGSADGESWLGKDVILNPNIAWGSDSNAQAGNYRILGMPDFGTFAEFVCVPFDRLCEKPPHLSAESASALPLAGMTAFRAVVSRAGIGSKRDEDFTQKTTEQKNILITGIGGGVALFALQIAHAFGANVAVTSGSEEKLARAQRLGAQFGVNYRAENWDKTLKSSVGNFDAVIDGTGGEQLNTLLALLKPGGTLVSYGATLGQPTSLNIQRIFWNQLNIHGSTMANDEEFSLMAKFVGLHKIEPVLDSVRPFDEILSAFDRMKNSEQFGKIVVSFA